LNLRDRVPALARLSQRMLGLSARRALPRWRTDTFWRAPQSRRGATVQDTLAAARAGRAAAVLFVDTFNASFETENALAVLHVLQRAGCTVHVLDKGERGGHHCCGRTFLAGGMVEQAKARLSTLIAALQPFAAAGVPVVGLEPSCLLTLRDEALALGLGEPARQVAAQALLFEEYLARETQSGRLKLALRGVDKPILLHGHCHQKAFGAVEPVMQVLRLIPGAQPKLIESSCCGMAGSFGYDEKHYEVSMAMAEQSLLPALRQQPDAIVVADGTSCRHQVAHGAQREAVHVARLLEELMQS
jgi:Fe-S oxidoreductase